MKPNSTLRTIAFALACTFSFVATPHSQAAAKSAEKPAVSPADAAMIAKARESYPLKTCIVSDEKLGDMGEAYGYVYREAGKPDRVVFFCCDGCVDDFKADPAKYLKKLDAASAKKGGKKKSNRKAEGATKEP